VITNVTLNETFSFGVGLHSMEDITYLVNGAGSKCVNFAVNIDGALTFAGAMGVMASFLAFLAFVMILTLCCVRMDTLFLVKAMAGTFFAVSVLALLALVRG
jgi:hypothetical protein